MSVDSYSYPQGAACVKLALALEEVFAHHRPQRVRPGEAGYNPWRQVEPAMAFMRLRNVSKDDPYSRIIERAYGTDTRLTDTDIQVLRELNGEDTGMPGGAAMWAAADHLKRLGYAKGLYEITQRGRDYLTFLDSNKD